MKNKKLLCWIGVFISMLFGLFMQKSVSAYTNVEQKALAYNIYRCYKNPIIADSISLNNFSGYKSVIGDSESNYVILPSGAKMSCRGLFGGSNVSLGAFASALGTLGVNISTSGSFRGLLKNADVDANPVSEVGKRTLLDKLGYVVTVENNNGKCLSFNLKRKTTANGLYSAVQTAQLCSKDGSANADQLELNNTKSAAATTIDIGSLVYQLSGNTLTARMWNGNINNQAFVDATFDLTQYKSFDALSAAIRAAMNSHFGSCVSEVGTMVGMQTTYCPNYDVSTGFVNYGGMEESKNATYQIGSSGRPAVATGAFKAATNLLGGSFSSVSDMRYSPDEMFQLYNAFLVNYYGVNGSDGVICSATESYDVMHNDRGYEQLPRLVDGQIRVCYAKATQNTTAKVNGLNNSRYFDGSEKTWQQLMQELNAVRNSLTVAGMVGGEANGDNTSYNESEDGTTTVADAETECKNGSGPLGWILCPIIQAVSGIGQTLWENIIEVLLEVPAKEIFVDDGGTRRAWELIQNIANVLFIVLFAFVIFSQLTGVGIDNYGIKRLLPRLILVAILANLSFVICELAIDASNIVGAGAKGIFTTAALNIPSSGNDTGVFVGGLAVDIGIGAGAAGIFAALNSLGLVGIPVAVGLAAIGLVISLVAGIIVLYLILVIREAGIVLMVAIAPIAIVCYALPNTEKLFKRWLSIMEALLVVYPLCSLAIGAGALASRALGTVDNGGMKLASMIVQVLPFFFIPMLLKNSLAGLGNVGAKLSAAGRSIGKRAGGALTGGIKNSERFKDFQQFQKDKTAAARADKVVKSLSGRTELTKRQRDRLNKAYMAQAARDRREREAEIGSDAEFQAIRMKNQEAAFAGEREKMYDRNFEFESDRGVIESSFIRSLSGNDGEYAASALKALINRGGITEAMNALQKDGVWEGMNDSVQQKLIQAMGATNVDVFKAFSKYRGSAGKAGIGFNRWMAGDAKDSGFKAASYGSYLSENGYGALNNVSKDEMQFVERNFNAISSTMSDPTELTGMLASAAVNSKDAKVQTVAEATLQKRISSGQMNIADMGLTADMIGSMRGSMAQAMAMGLAEKNAVRAQQIRANVAAQNPGLAGVELEKAQNAALLAEGQNLLRQELAPQIEAIKSDVRIKNRTTGQVLDILGIERGNGGGNVADTSVQIQQRPGFGATQTPSSQNDSWYNRYSGGGNPLNPPNPPNPPSPPNGQA